MADGTVRNRARAEQGRDFSGLVFGRISPSDIDGFLDFGGELFVAIELKLVGAELGRGQRLAYERIVNACEKSGARAVAIVARHTTPHDQAIPAASCVVSEWYQHGRWYPPQNRSITLRGAIDLLLAHEAIPWLCDEPPVHQAPLLFEDSAPSVEPAIRLVRSTGGASR